MKSPVAFQYRGNVFQQSRTVSLTPTDLRIRYEGGREALLPLSQIAKVDLMVRTSPAHGVAFICRVWKANALFPSLTLGSKSYRGFNDFEAKDTSYRAFVTQLHETISKTNPGCRFEVTVPESALLAALLSHLHLGVPVVFVVFLAALVIAGDIPAAVAAAVAAAIGCVAYAFWGMRKLGPWRYDPSAVPEAMLPRRGGEVFVE